MATSLGQSLIHHISAEDELGNRLCELVHRHGIDGLEAAVKKADLADWVRRRLREGKWLSVADEGEIVARYDRLTEKAEEDAEHGK